MVQVHHASFYLTFVQANSIRITGGELRGRLIKVSHEQDGFRPAQSRVREAIFSSLESEGRIDSARVLDLFAGAGTLGIEAVSRGASLAVFVEQHRKLAPALKKNLAELGIVDQTSVFEADVTKVSLSELVARAGGVFNIVFLDPPYKMADEEVESIIHRYATLEIVAPNAIYIVGRDKRSKLNSTNMGAVTEKARKVYGDSTISYYLAAI